MQRASHGVGSEFKHAAGTRRGRVQSSVWSWLHSLITGILCMVVLGIIVEFIDPSLTLISMSLIGMLTILAVLSDAETGF